MRAALVLLLVAACDLSDKHSCVVDDDCDPGRQCVDGTCHDPARVCTETDCALYSLSPLIAGAGQTLAIEGTFGSDLTIVFPGGIKVQPTKTTAHRALVVVPSGAGAGDLSAVSGGQTLGPLSFRASAFTPALIDTRVRPDQTSYARRPSHLAAARARFSLFTVGDFLYALGGEDASGQPIASLERARREADGSLSSFVPVGGAALGEPRAGAAVVGVADSVFVIGGSVAGGATSGTVESASLDADGTLGAFSTAGSLLTPRSDAAAVIAGDSLYVIGGRDADGAPLASVERARFQPDGTLGPFSAASALATARAGASCAVVGETLWVAGGEGAAGTLDSVEEAPLADSPGAFTSGPALTSARSYAAGVVLGGTLYLIGGESAGQPLDSVDALEGSAFRSFSSGLVAARSRAAVAIQGNFVYLAGGIGADGARDDLERLELDGTARTGRFSSSLPLPQPTGDASLVVLGRWLYVLGGKTDIAPVATLARAPVDENGGLGTFANSTMLVTPRHGFCTAVIDQSLYIIGGLNAAGVDEPTVEVAPIGDDGELGAFQVTSLGLVTPRHRIFCIVIGSWLYVIGGQVGTGNDLTSIEQAPITSDSTLGPFAVAPVSLLTPRRAAVGVIDGQRLFIAAGATGMETALSISERLDYDSDGTLHSPAPATELLEARRQPRSLIAGGRWIIVGGYRAGNSLTTLETSPFGEDGTFPTFTEVTDQLSVGRDAFSGVVLGAFFYALGGQNQAHNVSSVEKSPLQD
jgi:hypothetical protein